MSEFILRKPEISSDKGSDVEIDDPANLQNRNFIDDIVSDDEVHFYHQSDNYIPVIKNLLVR